MYTHCGGFELSDSEYEQHPPERAHLHPDGANKDQLSTCLGNLGGLKLEEKPKSPGKTNDTASKRNIVKHGENIRDESEGSSNDSSHEDANREP